ncbi:MAG TPA: hypothetical protein VJ890_14550 [Vineibacter sp.]|nr:hypothetical protein [Vineibacter sp.]
MTSRRSDPLIVACRRAAADRVMLHVITCGVCAAVALSRQQALQLTQALLVAASPPTAEPPPPPRQSRRMKARR